MISRVKGLLLPNRSRTGKDGSINKRARALSYDSGATGSSRSKENASNGPISPPPNSSHRSSASDADRPPLKEVGAGSPDESSPSSVPEQLQARQQEEKDFIRRNDTAEASTWYLVDVRWLQEWKHFVTRNAPLPGPIDNSRLLDINGTPIPGLRPVDDYRGVNEAIWLFWQQRYGGGPAVMRRQLDLYSPPVREDEASSTQNSSETGSDRRGAEMPLPGSASSRPHPSRSSGSARGSSRQADEGVASEETPPSPPRGRPAERPSSQSSKGRSSTSIRTLSAPAKDRANDADDAPSKPLCCDKCDGPHETDDCPHFRKPREKHADAWSSYGKKSSGDSKEAVHVVRNARVVPQPADGSCLFHSLSYGLSDRSTASSLRREICRYMESNPETIIADTLLKDWISYDGGGTVQSYAHNMSGGTWGGGIEMAALTKMKTVNVHVYEKCEEGYKRISSFNNPDAQKTISVLYQGRMHYDAIVVA